MTSPSLKLHLHSLWYWTKVYQAHKVVNYYGTWFGRKVHLRIEPEDFVQGCRHAHGLIDDRKWEEARQVMKMLARFTTDGESDPVLIRMGSFMDCMEEEID